MSLPPPAMMPSRAEDRPANALTHEIALDMVLKWVRQVDDSSPALGKIPGLNEVELRQLARVGSLIRVHLKQANHYVPQLATLVTSPEIFPTAQVSSAFSLLVPENAVQWMAELYARVVRPEHRRALGTFFTPRLAAQSMVDGYAGRHPSPEVVVDVGAGVGIFSEVARDRWPGAELHAVDINPVTLGLQAVVASARPDWNVALELEDYRTWLASRNPGGATLYLGNPPYTRWQLLDEQERSKLLDSVGGLVGTRANLSTLFLAMTLNKLRDEDSLAMIIPAGWMRADYGKQLRSRLRELGDRQVNLRVADSWRFDNAIVEAIVVEVGPVSERARPIRLSDWSEKVTRDLDRTGGETSFPSLAARVDVVQAISDETLRLGDVMRVTRGTATGAHSVFVHPREYWESLNIGHEFTHPLARRLRRGSSPATPIVERAELLVLEDYRKGAALAVDAWLEAGKARGVDQWHLCRKRKNWFDLSREVKVPDVILSALARDMFHLHVNDERFAITNNLFGIFWKAGVEPGVRTQVVSWLRSLEGQNALLDSASIEANDLRRLSPRVIPDIVMPFKQAVPEDSPAGRRTAERGSI